MKSVNMFVIDWLVVPIWCSLFALGNLKSALIMFPVTLVFAILNYRDSKKTVRLFMEDINLMGATILGILLNNLLFIRFIYADREKVSGMVVEIFTAMVYITLILVISMMIKEISRKRRKRIINKLINEPEDEGYDDDDDDEYDEYEDFEDDEDEKYETERRVLERMNQIRDNGETDEEGDTGENKGPKFKVVVKKGKSGRS